MAKSDVAVGTTEVRRYLAALDDPDSLIDPDAVSAAEMRVAAAKDPIERVVAYEELRKARHVDMAEARAGFLRHARDWAAQSEVTAEALYWSGVPTEDLIEAGFDAAEIASFGPRLKTESDSGRVAASEVERIARSSKEPFTMSWLVKASGASMGTVRKVLHQLDESGQLEDVGPDPSWNTRGSAPRLFRVRATP